MSQDDLGDRIKAYEREATFSRFLPMSPIYARIDGRSFSSFTKGMDRPFDPRMSQAMIDTTKYLVEQTGALLGYTQSDEISLVYYSDKYDSQVFFDGKKFKMISILAALATARFLQIATVNWPHKIAKGLPVFDCRAFQVPTKFEAANAVLWRVNDAVKNSVSMAARAYYSAKALHKKSQADMQNMLHAKGVNWNDYPQFFKEGTFIRRVRKMVALDDARMLEIPEQFRPTGPIERSVVDVIADMPQFRKVTNRTEFIFDGADPIVKSTEDNK